MRSILLYNGNIITMDNDNLITDSVIISDNYIKFVGKYEESKKYIDNKTLIINLNGRTVLPGFNDSHMHLLNYSLSKIKANLSKSKSIDDLKKILIKYKKNKTNIYNGWILGHGWNNENFEDKRLPVKEDIDEVISDRPVFLSRACYHIGVVNSKALELLGINKHTKDPEGGKIDRDPITNEPTGILRENALFLVSEKIKFNPKIEIVKEIIKDGIKEANICGITSIQTDDFSHIKDYKTILNAYNELSNTNQLDARINIQMLLENKEKLEEFLKLGLRTGDGNEWLRIGPLKLLADGSLGSRTAALLEDYYDEKGNKGILIYKDKEIEELLEIAYLNDLQLAVHTIGDRAMLQILRIYEKLNSKFYKNDVRFRLIHCQICNSMIYKMMKKLDVIADVQPIFLNSDLHIAEKRIGKDRMKYSYSFKSMIKEGLVLSGSSDAPIEPFNPLLGIYSAVNRKDLNSFPKGGWYSEESLNLIEAIKLFTVNSAYCTFEENIKGRIKKDYLADIVVLSENIMNVKPENIKDIYIDYTIVNGKIVYKRK